MTDRGILNVLESAQYEELKDAPAYITILVAGADGKIDEHELNWAEKLANIRSYDKPQELNQYYEDVEAVLDTRIKELLDELPSELEAREVEITKHLSKLNSMFKVVENELAYKLYTSFTSWAKHIAKASGGFLRFGSISSQEKKWIGLPMVDPVILEVVGEEE